MQYQTNTMGILFPILHNNALDIGNFKIHDILHIVHFVEVALLLIRHQEPYECVQDVYFDHLPV